MAWTLLIVDDHESFRSFAREMLRADGFAVCARMAEVTNPPVIVLTSSRDVSAYRRRLSETEARGFIPKGQLSGAALGALVG